MPYKYPRPYMRKLDGLEACSPALIWLRKRNFATLQEAWDVCEHYEWMCWLLQRLKVIHSFWVYDYERGNIERTMQEELLAYGQRSYTIPNSSLSRSIQRKCARTVRKYFPSAPDLT